MDDTHMRRAIALATKGLGFTSPNPAVGAVLVKNGHIIGEGYHKKAGGPHAEVVALADARTRGTSVRGATLYVTLEPCCHTGKTPPCTDAIVHAGIAEVVVGMKDPFARVNGKGLARLRRAGMRVSVVPRTHKIVQEIRLLNQPFLKWVMTGLPYVTLKAAVSLDGKIATRSGASRWITSQDARADARLERSRCDAVVVGAGTVTTDNPELAAHGIYKNKKLLRIIIDPTLSLALTTAQRVFRDEHVLVATTDRARPADRKRFDRAGIVYVQLGATRVSVKKLIQYLGERGVQSVFVEGGAGVHGTWCDAALRDPSVLDRILFYIAPTIIGGADALSAVGGRGAGQPSRALRAKHVTATQCGNSTKIDGRVVLY